MINSGSEKVYRIMGLQFTVTPTHGVLTVLTIAGVICMLVRFFTGFGLVTNLTDEWPWGLWIGFDVMTCVALAGGGYGMAIIAHIFHRQKYNSVVRGALLTSLLGYILVMAGLLLDIGRWYNCWVPFVSWGTTSVLFEILWCLSLYTTVQVLEMSEIVTERFGKRFHSAIQRIMPVLLILGVIFPVLHQSSLGALFLIAEPKMYPLYWSEYIPIFYLMSSFFVGPAVICVESSLARRFYGHQIRINTIHGLAVIGTRVMAVYFLLKWYDLFDRGLIGMAFGGTWEANVFLAEMLIGILIPILIVYSRWGQTRSGLITYGFLTSLGLVINRLATVFVGLSPGRDVSYFPSVWELLVTISLLSAGCLLYSFIVENLNIFGKNHNEKLKRMSRMLMRMPKSKAS